VFKQTKPSLPALLRLLRFLLPCLALLALTLSPPPAAQAHPLGNFSVNTYSRLELSAGQLRLLYLVDMAEIPTFQERTTIDADGDDNLSQSEQDRYLSTQATNLAGRLALTINGRPIPLQLQEQSLTFSPGQGGLDIQRISLQLTAALSDGESWQGQYQDGNYQDRLGWREIVIQARPGTTLLESSAPAASLSQELRQYPEDLLQSPINVRTATFRLATAASALNPVTKGDATNAETAGQNRYSQDQFAELINLPILGPGALLLALLASFGWGAAHAFTPGHGKTVVAAYLVGSRGTARHALFLGLTTTITHTLGVFVLGLLVLFASRYILPETLYPWLGVLSGILVVSIGLSMFGRRLRLWLHPFLTPHTHDPHHHDHQHDHDHPHTTSDHSSLVTHHDHSHLPPGANGTPVTWRSLLALGISGGLLPCPSALIMMLGAIALQRVGFGLVLILAFSVGLASVLTAVGLVMVYAGRLFERIPVLRGRGHLARALPIGSALVITLAGLGITLRALLETGLF
jgi:nickel/cobalt transporter (NicO) family protein